MRIALLILGLLVLASCANEQEAPESSPADTSPRVDDQGRTLYTMADVQARDSQSDCWTVVRGEVYDLTDFIRQHPGGSRAIVNMCGIDATTAFEGQHGGSPSPESTLEAYRIGVIG